MKLYATVTSERASKGQGGNKEIEITLQADAKLRKQVARLLFSVNPHVTNAYFLNVYTDKGITAFEFNLNETKGKKQKDESDLCSVCGSDYNPLCQTCRKEMREALK